MEVGREQKETHTVLDQRGDALAFAAEGTPLNASSVARAAIVAQRGQAAMAGAAATAGKHAALVPPAATCQQCLTLSFFFDGTGNNIDADLGTHQHSNVARLFLAHPLNDETVGRFAFYIYGIGTYFADIGDDGNTTRGLGFGHMGQERLNWAFDRFDDTVKKAEARAQNPTNKIRQIRVHVFGFSRGATLARAFVRDLERRCVLGPDGHRLREGNHPVEVGFLGIYDTVASVGLPMSANNTPLATSLGWYSLQTSLNVRARSVQTGVQVLAFGEPGADPAPGSFDGHASWADGLAVPPSGFVKRCVHMTAGHEIRNSFPLDSALDGHRYPNGVTEMVYPGAHSNVGGGYQPGEGARSPHRAEVLSLVSLLAMHAEARDAGVPLYATAALAERSAVLSQSFALDPEGAAKYAELADHWRHYTATVGSGGRHVGNEILNHLLWFNRWRFYNIRRNQAAAASGRPGPDAATAAQREQRFAEERQRLREELAPLDEASQQAARLHNRAQMNLRGAELAQARTGVPVPAALRSEEAQTRVAAAEARDRFLAHKARLDTHANDETLPGQFAAYDARLIADVELILAHRRANPRLTLRPHYRNLVEAYEDEFVRGRGLRDEKIIAFFDRYVHDSLAGFAQDATLPSDPRVVYAGGDNKMRFAGLVRPPGGRAVV